MKYKLHSKNEGSWTKWMAIDEGNKVRFVGLYKDVKNWVDKHSNKKNHNE